jgi:hypothetical protein
LAQEAGQERILLSQGFVGDEGDPTVAECGDERDDLASLEEAENALAGTVEEQAMKMGVAAEVAGGAMNGGDRAAVAAWV